MLDIKEEQERLTTWRTRVPEIEEQNNGTELIF